MIYQFAKRMMKETDKRLLWKLAFNFGYKGMRSVQKFKKRLTQGIHFPPFLFISVINSCQLRCQGCWVDVEAPRKMIDLDRMNRLITMRRSMATRTSAFSGASRLCIRSCWIFWKRIRIATSRSSRMVSSSPTKSRLGCGEIGNTTL